MQIVLAAKRPLLWRGSYTKERPKIFLFIFHLYLVAIYLVSYICIITTAKHLFAMTASAIFTAAHLAAKVADAAVAYRTRFTTALRAAWATAKQTAKTAMSTILATITIEDQHATPGTVPAQVFDIYHVVATASEFGPQAVAFVIRRPLREGGKARFYIASTLQYAAGGALLFANEAGQKFYGVSGINSLEDVDAREAARFGLTDADIAIATAAINA